LPLLLSSLLLLLSLPLLLAVLLLLGVCPVLQVSQLLLLDNQDASKDIKMFINSPGGFQKPFELCVCEGYRIRV
jgi:hypothetical protein